MDALHQLLQTWPLSLLGTALLVALVAAFLAGGWLRVRIGRPENQDNDGILLSASLTLLGLLIAFTFSMAVDRYNDRREVIIREGNAIGTAWLRAGLVDGAPGDALRKSIRDYTETRLRLPAAPQAAQVEAQSAAAQARVWTDLRRALSAMPAPIGATLITAVNEMFDAASARKAERDARIPGRVLDMLGLYAAIVAGIVGYVFRYRRDPHHLGETMILFVLLALAMTLILDLDRPWTGDITLSGQPVLDARAAMN